MYTYNKDSYMGTDICGGMLIYLSDIRYPTCWSASVNICDNLSFCCCEHAWHFSINIDLNCLTHSTFCNVICMKGFNNWKCNCFIHCRLLIAKSLVTNISYIVDCQLLKIKWQIFHAYHILVKNQFNNQCLSFQQVLKNRITWRKAKKFGLPLEKERIYLDSKILIPHENILIHYLKIQNPLLFYFLYTG